MGRLALGVAAATVLLGATACGSNASDESGQSSSRASRSPNASPSPTGANTAGTVVCDPSELVGNVVFGVFRLSDGAGDVWDINRRLSFPDADIRSAVVRHQGESLAITMNFAAPTDPKAGHQVGIDIRTDSGAQPFVDMIFGPQQHDSWLYKSPGGAFDPACSPTLNNYLGHGRITVLVRRRCLGSPRWVQVQIVHDRQGLRAGTQFVYWDNAHTKSSSPRGYTARVMYKSRTS